MIERLPGFWVPDGIVSGCFTPSFDMELAERCIAECGDRLTMAIDGGAYVGTFSNHLATRFRHVLAFEPMPENFACLCRNVADNVEAHEACLSTETGTVRMIEGKRGKTFNWQMSDAPSNGPRVKVQVVDDLKLQFLDLLKLDVEGGEFKTLCGAVRTLLRLRPFVLIEEKLDKERRASNLLQALGMQEAWRIKYDIFFKWRT